MMHVEMPREIQTKLRKALRGAGSREIGGLIMGEQINPGHFRIVDFTIDAITGSRANFVRSPKLHALALDEFFARTGNDYRRFNYLGEWHSHPMFPVNPSIQDIKSMTDLVNNELGIDFSILLIARLRWWQSIECSCTLFRQGYKPSLVELIK